MDWKVFFYNLAADKSKGFIAALCKVFLWLLSLIYGLIIRFLSFFYGAAPYRLNCKVISIGNITFGGTGKTSLVEYIARYLKGQGHKVAVLSRGYKRKVTSNEAMGDEPRMLAKLLPDIPIIVDTNRIRSGNRAIKEYGADTVVLDDGLQQWKIKKDLEIVTIDATNPFGNSQMIPRGILRQPLSGLSRADVFILTKTNLKPASAKIREDLNKYNPKALILESSHQPLGFYDINKADLLLENDFLRDKTATLFCGIGDPDSFEKLINILGINIGLSFRFPDHYNYTRADLDKIIQSSDEKNIGSIITTEKDAVRISDLRLATQNLKIFVLRIGLVINKNEEELHNRLLKLYTL